MKTVSKCIAILAIFFITSYTNPVKSSAQDEQVSFQVFYDNLAPYGTWVNMDPYGYVWIPNVAAGFAPYASNGYWANTDYGWTWVSDFDWGWAPFHYGRWDHNKVYGWYWVPDYTWGPAWVDWTYGPGYYGWCPLAPGISIDVALGGGWHPHDRRWAFVPEGYMGSRNIGAYYLPRERNTAILVNTHVINERYTDNGRHAVYISGPRRDDVQRITHTNVRVMDFQDRNTPGHGVSGNHINLYRPAIQSKPEAKPQHIEDVHNITPVKQRDDNYRQTQPTTIHPQIIKTQPFSQRQQQPQQQQQPQRQQSQPQQQRSAPQQQRSAPQQRSTPQQSAPRGNSGGGGGRRR